MRINIEQGSQNWLSLRQTKLGASEIAAALGVSKFMPKNLKELVEVKKGIRKVFYNQAMRDGNNYEARARELAEIHFGEMFEPHTYLEDERGVLIASLDGINMDETVGIEIKVSDKPMDELIDQYYPQMQQQLLVSPIVINYLVAYRKDTDTIEVSYPITENPDMQKATLEAEQAFVKAMVEYQPTSTDPLALQYADLARQKAEIEEELEAIKTQLIEKYQEGYSDTSITLYKTQGKKSIDYKKAIADKMPEIDLEPYTKTGKDTYCIRLAKEFV